MRTIRCYAVGALIVLGATTLVACTGTPPESPPSETASTPPAPSSSVSAEPEPEPEPDPVLEPEGSAEDNLPYFNFVNSKLLENGNPGGRAIIDNLVSAGFDKSAMEVTADRTPRGVAVDSLQFSVLLGDECLIGQAGAGGYTAILAPALHIGTCLIGKTRAIDW